MRGYMVWSLSALLCAGGCGLVDEFPQYQDRACNSVCGPCGLGRWQCESQSCSVQLSGVPEQARCGGDNAQVLVVDPMVKTSGDGSLSSPLQDMTQALAQEPDAIVILGAPELKFLGPMRVPTSLYGGFIRAQDGQVSPSPMTKPLIQGFRDEQGDAFGLLLNGKGAQITLSYLRIQAPSAMRHSYGLLALQAELTLDHVNILASNAPNGKKGAQGEMGAQGQSGKRSLSSVSGVPGIQPLCPLSAGGSGGRGQIRTAQNDRPATSGNNSMLQTLGGEPGQPGETGEPGQSGDKGQDAQPSSIVGERWQWGKAATAGLPGAPGAGGGGGGGGLVSQNGEALGGSGGGSGGCGGQGGTSATSGGSSFGVMLISSSMLALDSEFTAAQAGLGGEGGLGGDGGQGAQGGPQTSNSGAGGSGGQGGQGGAGGDGAGGSSIALYCHQSDVQITNVLLKHALAQSIEQAPGRSTEGIPKLNCGD